MKKLLLIACLFCVGCSGHVRIESKPSQPDPPPRLIVNDHSPKGIGPWIYIVQDTQNGIEYLVVKTGNGLSVCKMDPPKAEHEAN